MTELQKIKVMIIDPAGYSRTLLREILVSLGVLDVIPVSDGDKALRALQTHYRNVIFCDESCRNTAGFIKSLRRDTKTKNIIVPVFLISAGVREEQIIVARDAGMNGVIVKPISTATVKRKLKVALGSPKDWIASKEFIGPDRRANRQDRRVSDDPLGFPDRRGSSERKANVFLVSPLLKPDP